VGEETTCFFCKKISRKNLSYRWMYVYCIYKVHSRMYIYVQCTYKKWQGKFYDRNYAIEIRNSFLSKWTLSEYTCEKLAHLQIAVAVQILKYMLVIRNVVKYYM
jgi:hypothetical protein